MRGGHTAARGRAPTPSLAASESGRTVEGASTPCLFPWRSSQIWGFLSLIGRQTGGVVRSALAGVAVVSGWGCGLSSHRPCPRARMVVRITSDCKLLARPGGQIYCNWRVGGAERMPTGAGSARRGATAAGCGTPQGMVARVGSGLRRQRVVPVVGRANSFPRSCSPRMARFLFWP